MVHQEDGDEGLGRNTEQEWRHLLYPSKVCVRAWT